MAAPHVAGAVALVAAANPGLTATEIRTRILNTVEPVPALAGLVATGGKLNVRRAVFPALLRPYVAITSPAAEVMVLDQAGLAVALAAAVLPDKGYFAVPALTWEAPEGPAPVSFSTTTGADTVATFPAPGRYRIRVRATAGPLEESDTLVVAVGDATQPDTAGLRAWWRFNETGGVALDDSGDNRIGSLVGATRGVGVFGDGVSFNGSSGHVAFTSPGLSRVTIAGWARAIGAGNSPFPRIVHMREGLLFFGIDGGATADDGNNNTLKFALDDGSNAPVWHSPPGTITRPPRHSSSMGCPRCWARRPPGPARPRRSAWDRVSSAIAATPRVSGMAPWTRSASTIGRWPRPSCRSWGTKSRCTRWPAAG
jgi:hypothetical protein